VPGRMLQSFHRAAMSMMSYGFLDDTDRNALQDLSPVPRVALVKVLFGQITKNCVGVWSTPNCSHEGLVRNGGRPQSKW
jgi:hypothetical protein